MTPRRTHSKSRKGCDTCRNRRVKCDENGPPCTNCSTRKLNCTYLKREKLTNTWHVSNGLPQRSARAVNSTRSSDNGILPTILPSIQEATRPMTHRRELELLHRYSTSTWLSLTRIYGNATDIWQQHVVGLAFHYQFLLDGIFSLSASQIAHFVPTPELKQEYQVCASGYLDSGVAVYRAQLPEIGHENVQAVYIFGIILVVNLFSQLQSLAPTLTWDALLARLDGIYFHLKAVDRIVTDRLEELRASPIGPIITLLGRKHDIHINDDIKAALAQLRELLTTYDKSTGRPDEQSQWYGSLITDLHACWTESIFVIDWYTNTGHRFQRQIQQPTGNTNEVLLLAYWGTALHRLNDHWFVSDLGRVIVGMCMGRLRDVDAKLWPALQWVEGQVGGRVA